MKKNLILFYVFIVLFASEGKSHFCFAAEGGARPISMGGAFVAVSDDVHAVSWNPAALAWQEQNEVAYSAILDDRNDYIPSEFISDDYFACAMPIKVDEQGRRIYDVLGGIGFFVNSNIYKPNVPNTTTKLWHSGVSFGKKFSDYENMAWGVTLNYYLFEAELPYESSSDTAIGLNLGYLWYVTDYLTVGFLWENINEPTYTILSQSCRLLRNLRPALAWYIGDSAILSLEMYDATGNTKDKGSDLSQDLRLGFEYYLTDVLSLRLGAHHFNSDTDAAKYYSAGLGFQRTDFFMGYPVTYYLDYTFVSWNDAPAGMADYTHQIGLTAKF